MRLARFLLCSVLAAWPAAARAAFEPRGIGARPLALGGAFTAAHNDVTSVYWNPAGLSSLEKREVHFSYTDLYSQGLVNYSNLAFGYPGVGPGSFAVSWSRFGVSGKVPFDYSENTYTVAYSMRLPTNLSLGGALNYYKLTSTVKGSGFGLNAGLRYRPWVPVAFGATLHSLGRTTVRYDSGAEDPLPRDFRVGVAFHHRLGSLFVDVDRLHKKAAGHAGLELPFFADAFNLRSGVSRRFDRNVEWVYSAGFGVNWRSLVLDYAFENHFDLGGSHVVSMRWRF